MRRQSQGLAAILAGLCLAAGPAALRAEARQDYLAGTAAMQAKTWDEAAQDFTRVTAQAPRYAQGWKQLATCRYYLGDLEGAVASSDRYLDLAPADTAFSAWEAGLRARLRLPPRAVATPVPTLSPSPLPTPAPAGILQAAPPPGADAELAPSAAGAASPAAAEGAAPAQSVAAQSVAAQSAVPQSMETQSMAPPETARRWGLRLLGGWSWGLGSTSFGESVDSSTLASASGYASKPASGLSGVVEALASLGEHLDLTLGAYPISWDDQEQSSATTAVTRSNNSEASAVFLPLMLGLSWHQPLGNATLVAALGLGAVPAAQVTVKSQTTQTQTDSLLTYTGTSTIQYGLAPTWRIWLGAEWAISASVAVDLGLQALGASFAAQGGSGQLQITDQDGAAQPGSGAFSTQPQALSVLSLGALAGLAVRF